MVVGVLPGTQHLTPTEDGADSGLRLLCSQALHSTERVSWTSLSQPPNSRNQPSQHTAEAGKRASRRCSLLTGRASDLSMSLLLSLVFFCLLACCCLSFMAWLRSSRKCGWEDQHRFRTIKRTLAESPFSLECSSGIELPCSSLILHPFPLRAAKCSEHQEKDDKDTAQGRPRWSWTAQQSHRGPDALGTDLDSLPMREHVCWLNPRLLSVPVFFSPISSIQPRQIH